PETSCCTSQLCSPLPRAILFRWVFRRHENWRSLFRWCPLDLTQITCLHRLSQCESQVPDPLASDLPEFLSTLHVGAPAVGIFFDVFISQYCPRSAPRP